MLSLKLSRSTAGSALQDVQPRLGIPGLVWLLWTALSLLPVANVGGMLTSMAALFQSCFFISSQSL